MTDGVININKPAGWTSQDICAKLRSRLHIRKIGHTGTLDPMATGVLPVCIGKATRIIEYYDGDRKSYHAAMQLGIVTDTLDITGTVTEENGFSGVSEDAVRKAFAEYQGVVTQIPPKYSALKINGKRAYDLARSGEDFEIKGREITIFSNEITSLDPEKGLIEFDVTCSKGTYIRTICDDIGRTLGCGAAMTALTRTANGFFRLEDAADINDLVKMSDEEIAGRVIPMDRTLISVGTIELNDNRITAFISGNTSYGRVFRITEACRARQDGEPAYKVYGGGRFLGIGTVEKDVLIPRKVLV